MTWGSIQTVYVQACKVWMIVLDLGCPDSSITKPFIQAGKIKNKTYVRLRACMQGPAGACFLPLHLRPQGSLTVNLELMFSQEAGSPQA